MSKITINNEQNYYLLTKKLAQIIYLKLENGTFATTSVENSNPSFNQTAPRVQRIRSVVFVPVVTLFSYLHRDLYGAYL
jgi:hypothetical protein